MNTVFADTGYWIALLNPHDDLHERAQEVSRALGAVRILTTEMVLVELLNYYAGRGAAKRKAAVDLVNELFKNPNVIVLPQTSIQFQNGIGFYADRLDKHWSHTDCCSFKTMEDHKICEALTHDRHFEQAGFVALLREDSSE